MVLNKNTFSYFFIVFVAFLLFFYLIQYKYDSSRINVLYIDNDTMIKEGFVTFATKSHFGLLRVLIESIHIFSNRSLVAYGIDDDIPFDYPRLIKRKIRKLDCGTNIYYCKPYVILNSNIRNGIYLDVDGIVNKDVDILFEIARSWIGNHSLSPLHPRDPNNQMKYMKQYNISKKSMPYVHGHVIWNEKNIDFLKKWYTLSKEIRSSNFDETALNILLWSINARHYTFAYDPFFLFYKDYLENKTRRKPITYSYLLFHGCKNPIDSQQILDKLLESFHSKTKLVSNLNNTIEYCSKPSKVAKHHPYICESML